MVINEIFNSVDGEVNKYGQGVFSTFIRTAGCNLRCKYCDTKYAQDSKDGIQMEISEILERVKKIGCPKVTITGGEPLFQTAHFEQLVYALLRNEICDITVETNGTFSIRRYPTSGISWIIDCKTPGAEKDVYFHEPNMTWVKSNDYIKFVICDEEDYRFAKEKMHRLITLFRPPCKWAFSPVYGAQSLIDWMQRDKLWDVQLNIQLHKYIGIL